MKRVLVAGVNSYIGDSFIKYMRQWPDQYEVSTLDLRTDAWMKADLGGYDAVYYVTGIAHKKETPENAPEYYKINRDLTIRFAEKSKQEGVKQFIFLSSGTVYGLEAGIITPNTKLNPKTHYGKSKAEAEIALSDMSDDTFKVAILRPLMVYGKGCKGNFQSLIKIIKASPVFPRVHNKRSLVYIDNLSSFVKEAIDNNIFGVFFPKNNENVDIYDLAIGIATGLNKSLYMSYILGGAIYLFRGLFSMTRKAFSDMIYVDTDNVNFKYCVVTTKDSITKSV